MNDAVDLAAMNDQASNDGASNDGASNDGASNDQASGDRASRDRASRGRADDDGASSLAAVDTAAADLGDSRPPRGNVLRLVRVDAHAAQRAEVEVAAATAGDGSAREPRALPAGTVTFLLTDVEGSTPLWDASPERMAAAMRRHEQLLSAAIERHGGARPMEQGEGDNVVAAFARASDAAQAAIDAQRALIAESRLAESRLAENLTVAGGEAEGPAEGVGAPPPFAVRVRMALHTGEAHLQEGRTYAGPDLNRCARLRGLAHGGQIVVSRTTHDLLADAGVEDLSFRDLGAHRLRGLERPEHVHQLCHPDLPADFPALTHTEEHPSTLPRPATPLIGRDVERDEVLRLFDGAALVTLAGSGGCGKTRLAIEVGASLRASAPDGVWWIDLASVADPALVAGVILAGIGSRDEGGADPAGALAASIGDRRLVLVIDNAEHLLDECARLLHLILERCASTRVLVTSREPIGLEAEWSYRVPSLAVPVIDAKADAVMASPAVRLFEARAAQARPGFRVTDANAAPVAQICRRLDGIPLAIELAAARVRVMSVVQIAEGLDDRFRLLAGGGRRVVARQQTLRASVEWSHGLLDEDERRCLRRLAVFVGGFTLDAAEAVVSGDDLDPPAVLDLITRLVDKSVVVAATTSSDEGGTGEPPPAAVRYRLLETIRQFVHERLEAADEVQVARDRHLAWVQELAGAAEPELTGRSQAMWLDRLESERDNLRAAADWAATTGDGAALWALAGHLAFFWVLHGHFADAAQVIDRARELTENSVELGQAVPPEVQLAGRWSSAYVALYAGDYERGYLEALDVIARARSAGDDRICGRALDTLATIEVFVDLLGARSHLEEAIPLARAAGDEWCLSDALQIVGFSYLLQGVPEAGAAAMAEAREIAERLDNQQLLGWDHCFNGWTHALAGRLDEAQRAGEAAVLAAGACGDPAVGTNALVVLSDVAIRRGQAAEIVPVLSEALEHLQHGGGSQSIPALASRVAETLTASGRPADAMALLDEYEGAVEAGGGQVDKIYFHEFRARAAMALGHLDVARAAAQRARDVAREIQNESSAAVAATDLSWIALGEGRVKDADQLAHGAVKALFALGHVAECADAILLCGLTASALDRPVEATRLLAAALAIVERTGAVATHLTAALGQPDTGALAAELGADAFASAWAEGAALTLAEAVALVGRNRGSRRRPPAGWDSLTPTELSVVELAAEGLTNKAIADRLFVSPATVKTHLAHVFAKLGMANRAELAAEVSRRRARS